MVIDGHQSSQDAEQGDWTISHHQVKLFCLPYAGGGTSVFSRWRSLVPEVLEIVPLQLPGREDRIAESPVTRWPDVVGEVFDLMLPCLKGLYALFGHSMGALIMYELAHYLRTQQHDQPLCLFVAAHRAPHLALRRPRVSELSDGELARHIARLDGTQEELLANTELMQLVFPILRADFTLCERYRYTARTPLDCPIVGFGGTHDPVVTREELAAWRCHTRSWFSLSMFPGGHFFIRDALPRIGGAVRDAVARCCGGAVFLPGGDAW